MNPAEYLPEPNPERDFETGFYETARDWQKILDEKNGNDVPLALRERIATILDSMWPYMGEVLHFHGMSVTFEFGERGELVQTGLDTLSEQVISNGLCILDVELPDGTGPRPTIMHSVITRITGSSPSPHTVAELTSYAYLPLEHVSYMPINALQTGPEIESSEINFEKAMTLLQKRSAQLQNRLRTAKFRGMSPVRQARLVDEFVDRTEKIIPRGQMMGLLTEKAIKPIRDGGLEQVEIPEGVVYGINLGIVCLGRESIESGVLKNGGELPGEIAGLSLVLDVPIGEDDNPLYDVDDKQALFVPLSGDVKFSH